MFVIVVLRRHQLQLAKLIRDPAIAIFLELMGYLRAASHHDAAVEKDVHEIGLDLVQNALVMGDQ